ncbi:MAG TPA: DnaB-like helicase N-terminal domain-containing protein, partial [Candidatus Dormibacteraeota bacterium]
MSSDRTPPQDIEAEQATLGGMMLSKDVIDEVTEIVTTADFYRHIHTTVFQAILDLHHKGEPADARTVTAALADAGELQRIGGAAYIHTLIEAVPTAANAPYYARTVANRAVSRRLVEAGIRISQLGYGSANDEGVGLPAVVNLAQQAVYDITTDRGQSEYSQLGEML